MATVDIEGQSINTTEGKSTGPDFINEDFVRPLQQLMPHGVAWTRVVGSVMTLLIRAISYSFTRIQRRIADLIRESDPSTTNEMLTDWETTLGLPGDCSTPTTTAGRRNAIISKLRGFGDPDKALFQSIAESLGFATSRYARRTPFRAGSGQAGDRCYGEEWPFQTEIIVPYTGDEALLQCRIDEIAPLHTKLLVQNWSLDTWNLTDTLNGVAHGNGIWIAVGENGRILRSTDGLTWTIEDPAASFTGTFYDVAFGEDEYGDPLFVAVGDTEVQYSDDGTTWTQVSWDGVFNAKAIIWADGVWVAAGATTTPTNKSTQSSDDGITWTSYNSGLGGTLYAIGRTSTHFFVAGDPVGGQAVCLASTDGLSWATRNAGGALTGQLNGVAWDGTVLLVVGSGGRIHTTEETDGASGTWTARTAAGSYADEFNDAHGHTGALMICGENGEIQFSSDQGATWTDIGSCPYADMDNIDLESIGFNSDLSSYVVCGTNGLTLTS